MPSKGIDCYSYITPSLANQYEVVFTVPKGEVRNDVQANFTKHHLEVESDNIPGEFNFVGRFEWKVLEDGNEIGSKHNDINAFTGNLKGGTMLSTQSFTPIMTDKVIITYGFYDAGHGVAGLTNHDQCYVTVCSTQNQSWMGTVAHEGSTEAEKPFSRFALVAPHDNGMNSMHNVDAVLQAVDLDMVNELKRLVPRLHWFDHIPDEVIIHMVSTTDSLRHLSVVLSRRVWR